MYNSWLSLLQIFLSVVFRCLAVGRLVDSPLQDWGAPPTIMLTTTTDYKKNFHEKLIACALKQDSPNAHKAKP